MIPFQMRSGRFAARNEMGTAVIFFIDKHHFFIFFGLTIFIICLIIISDSGAEGV